MTFAVTLVMRPTGLVLLALGSFLAACTGGAAPDDPGQTASEQKAGDNAQGDSAKSSGSEANGSNGSTTTGASSNTCFKDFGPSVAGECTVGDERPCEGYDPSTSPPTGTFCEEKCINVDGAAKWGLQTHNLYCPFYDTSYHLEIQGCECNTPLVLSFDDAPVTFTSAAGGAFDLAHDGMCHGSDWVSAVTPWLALDRDANGSIDDGSELFGSATPLVGGGFAKNGFEALRELDANHDGVFDSRDPAFAKVVVWADRNANRRSSPNELTSLADAGITRSISVRIAKSVATYAATARVSGADSRSSSLRSLEARHCDRRVSEAALNALSACRQEHALRHCPTMFLALGMPSGIAQQCFWALGMPSGIAQQCFWALGMPSGIAQQCFWALGMPSGIAQQCFWALGMPSGIARQCFWALGMPSGIAQQCFGHSGSLPALPGNVFGHTRWPASPSSSTKKNFVRPSKTPPMSRPCSGYHSGIRGEVICPEGTS